MREALHRAAHAVRHREEIKASYGLREFAEAEAEFAQWARSWNTGQGPKLAMSNRVKALITSMWAACSLRRPPSRYDRIVQATSGCDTAR